MKVLAKSILPSTITQKSVTGCFRAPGITDVIFAKGSSLELLAVTDDGRLHSVWQQPFCGSITEVKAFPWSASLRGSHCPEELHGKDLIALLSDSGNLTFVTFDSGLHRFVAVCHMLLSQEGFNCEEVPQYLAVERNGSAVAVAAFRNRLALFPACTRQDPAELSSFYGSGAEVVDRRASLYFGKDTLDPGSSSRQQCGGALSEWGTIWSMEFLDTDLSRPGAPAFMRLAAAVHRAGSLCSEVQVLQWERGNRSMHCVARLSMPHEEQLGVLQQVLPVPRSHSAMVAVGTKALMVLDWGTLDVCCNGSSGSSGWFGQGSLQPDPHNTSSREASLSSLDQPSAPTKAAPVVQLPSVFTPEPSPSAPLAPRMVELFLLPVTQRDATCDSSVEHTSLSLPFQMQVDDQEGAGGLAAAGWDGMLEEEPHFHLTPSTPTGAELDPVRLPAVTDTSWQDSREQNAGPLSSHWTAELLLAMDSGDLHFLTVRSHTVMGSQQAIAGPYEELEASLSSSQYKAASPAKAITTLPNSSVILHCDSGDTEVLQMPKPSPGAASGDRGDSKFTQVWSQLSTGPILDFVAADLCMEGQPQLYTASAHPGGGSVRVIRTSRGVDLLHKTPPDYCGLSNMWSVMVNASDRSHSLIVLSFVGGTRVLRAGLVLKDVTDTIGVASEEPTVAVGRLLDGLIAQVTRGSVRLCNLGLEWEGGELEGALRGSAFRRSSSGSHARSQSCGNMHSPSLEASATDHPSLSNLSPTGSVCEARPSPPETQASVTQGEPLASEPMTGDSNRGYRGVDDVWLSPEGNPISLAAVSKSNVVLFSAHNRQLLLLGLLQGDQDGGGMSPEPSHSAPRSRKRRKRYCLEALSSLGMADEVSCISVLPIRESQKLGPAEQLIICGTYGCTVEVLAITCHPPCSSLVLQKPQLLHVSSFSLDLPRQSGFLHHFGPLGKPGTREPFATSHVKSVPGSCQASYSGSGPLQVLVGLRNGTLVQLESLQTSGARSGSSMSASQPGPGSERTAWGLCSGGLQMVLNRRLGSAPIALIPTDEGSHPTFLALGERPWLVCLAPCTRRMEQVPLAMPSTAHAAAVPLPGLAADGRKDRWATRSFLCYREDGSLLLAAVECEERVNCSVWGMDASPRRLALHPPSNSLVALVSKPVQKAEAHSPPFEVRCLAPREGGRQLALFPLDPGEAGTCMCLWQQTATTQSWTQHSDTGDDLSTWNPAGFEAPSSVSGPRDRKLSPASCSGTVSSNVGMRSFSQPPPRTIEHNMEENGANTWLGGLLKGAQEQAIAACSQNSLKDAAYIVVGTSRHWPIPTMEVVDGGGHHPYPRRTPSRCKGRILVLCLEHGSDSEPELAPCWLTCMNMATRDSIMYFFFILHTFLLYSLLVCCLRRYGVTSPKMILPANGAFSWCQSSSLGRRCLLWPLIPPVISSPRLGPTCWPTRCSLVERLSELPGWLAEYLLCLCLSALKQAQSLPVIGRTPSSRTSLWRNQGQTALMAPTLTAALRSSSFMSCMLTPRTQLSPTARCSHRQAFQAYRGLRR